MQSSCGRGNRTSLARIDGLVTLVIGLRIVAMYVGRQRNVADCMQRFVQEYTGKVKAEQHLAALALLEHRGVELAKKA